MSELRDVEAQWRPIGVQLGVPDAQLQNIQATHGHLGQTQCMMEMLSFWLKSTIEASWRYIVEALGKDPIYATLVNSLKTKYLQSSTVAGMS